MAEKRERLTTFDKAIILNERNIAKCQAQIDKLNERIESLQAENASIKKFQAVQE